MKVEKAYTIPEDWEMADLSPKSYTKLITDLQENEMKTLAFSKKIGMGKAAVEIEGTICDKRCRLFFTCGYNYADNE